MRDSSEVCGRKNKESEYFVGKGQGDLKKLWTPTVYSLSGLIPMVLHPPLSNLPAAHSSASLPHAILAVVPTVPSLCKAQIKLGFRYCWGNLVLPQKSVGNYDQGKSHNLIVSNQNVIL